MYFILESYLLSFGINCWCSLSGFKQTKDDIRLALQTIDKCWVVLVTSQLIFSFSVSFIRFPVDFHTSWCSWLIEALALVLTNFYLLWRNSCCPKNGSVYSGSWLCIDLWFWDFDSHRSSENYDCSNEKRGKSFMSSSMDLSMSPRKMTRNWDCHPAYVESSI